ncbi:MAG: hypothetical protein E6G56_07725 [Actinobacteria bacterium]|nr:MAG: hypothetical protein E6G56_07725 [Actinomycetota bacterium]
MVLALTAAALNLLAGALGAWRYYAGVHSRAFWPLLRVAQAAALAVALLTGALAAAGRHPRDDLYYLYALVPLAVGLVAEQLRVASAESVLAACGLASAREVEGLSPDEQRSLVAAILRRELGVMAASALVVCFLELRAAGTAHGF